MPTSPAPRGTSSKLFTPLAIAGGTIALKHRVIMAPMTRNRAVPLAKDAPNSLNRIWVPDALMAEYYAQRATDGDLIVTESILPSLEAGAMPGVPGMWLPEHLEGWKLVLPSHPKGRKDAEYSKMRGWPSNPSIGKFKFDVLDHSFAALGI